MTDSAPVSDFRVAAALEATRPTIVRLLRPAFEHLDALTPDVETRRRLYACSIARAANAVEERLPDSDADREAIAGIFALSDDDVCFLVIEKQTHDLQTRTFHGSSRAVRFSILSASTQKRTVRFLIRLLCRGDIQRPEAPKTRIPMDRHLQPAGSYTGGFLKPAGT